MAKLSPSGKPVCSSCRRLAVYRVPGHDRITGKIFYAYRCAKHALPDSEPIPAQEASAHYQIELEKMQDILAQLHAMTPLPIIGSEEARTHHAAWMSAYDAITEAEQHAEGWALLSVPSEVRTLLEQIRERRRVLLNMTSRSSEK